MQLCAHIYIKYVIDAYGVGIRDAVEWPKSGWNVTSKDLSFFTLNQSRVWSQIVFEFSLQAYVVFNFGINHAGVMT